MKFCELNYKKKKNYVKEIDVLRTYMNFAVAMAKLKIIVTQLKVSVPWSKSLSFENFEKILPLLLPHTHTHVRPKV